MGQKKGLNDSELTKLRFAQSHAKSIAWEIANSIEVGMNEKDAYHIANTVFKNYGLKYHWHYPYIGLGQGTNKLKSVSSLFGSLFNMKVKLSENDLIMIDIAPIIEGYPSDYTVTKVVGNHKERQEHCDFTKQTAFKMIEMVENKMTNKEIFIETKKIVQKSGKYVVGEVPVINLGHRILKLPRFTYYVPEGRLPFLLFYPGPAFLNGRWNRTLDRLWAIEPYILSNDRAAKHEELIYVDPEFHVHRLNID